MTTKTVTTNAEGKATLEGVKAGELSITISARGFQPKTTTITVGENATSFTEMMERPTIPNDPSEL